MSTLKDKAEILERELGFDPGLPIAETIDQAIVLLGLKEEVASLPLIQKAEACVIKLTGSTAPIPTGTVIVEAFSAGLPMTEPMGLVVGGAYRLNHSHMNWHEHDHLARSQGCTLAPVTSREEQEAVMSAAGGQTVWIGAVRHGPGNGPGADHWHWSSGEPWSYTNWCRGEPNNFQGMEDCVQMYGRRELRPQWGMNANDGEWNDINSGWRGPAVYKVGGGTWTPSPEQMQRDGFQMVNTESLRGCWIGSVLGILPWAASLEPQGTDVYTRNFQCCMFLPINCGNRYVRVGHTSTFKATDEDIEVFTSERWSNFTPTPGCGIRIC